MIVDYIKGVFFCSINYSKL